MMGYTDRGEGNKQGCCYSTSKTETLVPSSFGRLPLRAESYHKLRLQLQSSDFNFFATPPLAAASSASLFCLNLALAAFARRSN
jgi:hypothetical protein